jgi:hypothetical protein
MPIGPTSLIAANATAPSGVQLASDPTAATMEWVQYRIQNNGTQTAFYAFGSNATVAQTNAAIPTNASVGANSYPLPAGAVEVITAKPAQFWSAITASNFAGAAIFITPGRGV